jgi:hypothetical protein
MEAYCALSHSEPENRFFPANQVSRLLERLPLIAVQQVNSNPGVPTALPRKAVGMPVPSRDNFARTS